MRKLFWPLNGYISKCAGPGTLPYGEMKSSLGLCWACCLEISSPCSGFVLLYCVSPVAPEQSHCCVCSWQGGNKVLGLQHKPSPRQLQGETHWPVGDLNSLLRPTLLYPSVSRGGHVMEPPWPARAWVVSFLVTLTKWVDSLGFLLQVEGNSFHLLDTTGIHFALSSS